MKTASLDVNLLSSRKIIPKEYKEEFHNEILQINVKREKLLSFILILITIILFCVDAAASEFWKKDTHIFAKFSLLHFLLFLTPLIFLFLNSIGNLIKKPDILNKISHLYIITVVLNLSAIISLIIPTRELFSYITALTCISSLLVLTKYEKYIAFGSSYFICIFGLIQRTNDFASFSKYFLFLDLLNVLAFIASSINYEAYIKNFVDKKIILKQNIELKEISTLLKSQQEASPDGILIVNRDRKVISCNQKFIDLWYIPDNDCIGKDIDELIKYIMNNVENETECILRMNKVLSEPLKSSSDTIRLLNGLILEIYSAPIIIKGSLYGRVWNFCNITEKERMYEALLKSSEENEKLLKEAMKYDEMKSEFFSNISHEFRTPINVILGTLQLMMKKASNNQIDTDSRTKYVKIMKQNCYRLLRLTNNLIDITRLDNGFLEINLHNYNIVQIIEDITVSVAEFVENKGVSLIFDTDVEEKFIAVDADKVERIILNLLSNAIKFTKENGTIWVNIKDRGKWIEVRVKDTGIGIPQDKLSEIFERFRQVNSTLSRNSEGSGIGLSLIKNLIELHGGSIEVNSEINKGSEFIVKFPCTTVVEEVSGKPVTFNSQTHVERICIEFSDIYSI